MPNKMPNKNPPMISLFKIFHQSAMEISPTDIACIINVEDCDPELPPVDKINGIKLASTNTFANSSSK